MAFKRSTVVYVTFVIAISLCLLSGCSTSVSRWKRDRVSTAVGVPSLPMTLSRECVERILSACNCKGIAAILEVVYQARSDAEYLAVAFSAETFSGATEGLYHQTFVLRKEAGANGWRNATLYTTNMALTRLFGLPSDDLKTHLKDWNRQVEEWKRSSPPRGIGVRVPGKGQQ